MNSGTRTKSNVTQLRKRQPAILVVEHQILTRTSIAESLRQWGFRAYEAGNGDEAVTLLSSGKIEIAFLLIDLDMPGPMDGKSLTEWLRENAPHVVALLASTSRKKSAIADALGAHFIAKPYDARKVLVIIRNALPRKR